MKKEEKNDLIFFLIFFFRPDGLIMLNEMPSMYSGYVGKIKKLNFKQFFYLLEKSKNHLLRIIFLDFEKGLNVTKQTKLIYEPDHFQQFVIFQLILKLKFQKIQQEIMFSCFILFFLKNPNLKPLRFVYKNQNV